MNTEPIETGHLGFHLLRSSYERAPSFGVKLHDYFNQILLKSDIGRKTLVKLGSDARVKQLEGKWVSTGGSAQTFSL